MADDTPIELSEEKLAELNFAVLCGLTARDGPYPDDVATMTRWRQALLPLLPRRQRWRLSALAPHTHTYSLGSEAQHSALRLAAWQPPSSRTVPPEENPPHTVGTSERKHTIMRKHALIDTYLDQTLTTPQGGPPPRPPAFVFGTAHRRRSRTWENLHTRQDELIREIERAGFTAQPGYAVGFLRTFVEPVIYATDLEIDDAISIAESQRLEFFIRLHFTGVYLYETKAGPVWIAEAPTRRWEEAGTCLMPNESPDSICHMRGGPYGSRAINASLDWTRERQRLIAALGCATCTNGTYYRMHGVEHPLTGGGPIGLDAHEVPTRYTAMVEVPHA